MQFSTVLFAAVALATGISADLHTRGWCADRDIDLKSGVESNPANADATQKACDRYKARKTGNQQWDKCPDCKTSLRGDEWDYYCKLVGADMGKAS